MSAVAQFNKHLFTFVEQLRTIMGEDDTDLNAFVEYADLVHVNIRLFVTPFQKYVASDMRYVRAILASDRKWLIDWDFVQDPRLAEYNGKFADKKERVVVKLKQLIAKVPEPEMTCIFNAMKILIYFALLDQFKEDAQPEQRVHLYLELCHSQPPQQPKTNAAASATHQTAETNC